MQHLITEFVTYTPYDILTIVTLIVLEGLLSVDNALVLATLVKKVPRALQKRALTYGVFGAIFFRIVAVILAAYLIKIAIIKLIGGVYLIHLAFRHMFPSHKDSEGHHEEPKHQLTSFWKTVILVELTDIVFSIDSITTAVAMTPKITVIIIGGIAGILAMRYVAMIFIKLLEKFEHLDDIAYQIVFFIGIKISLESLSHLFNLSFEVDDKTFWIVLIFIVLVGISTIMKRKAEKQEETSRLVSSSDEDWILNIENNEVSLPELFHSDRAFSSDFIRYLIKNGYLEYTRKATLPRVKKSTIEMYAEESEKEENKVEKQNSGSE